MYDSSKGTSSEEPQTTRGGVVETEGPETIGPWSAMRKRPPLGSFVARGSHGLHGSSIASKPPPFAWTGLRSSSHRGWAGPAPWSSMDCKRNGREWTRVICGFNYPFFSPRSFFRLENDTYQLVSLWCLIWYIYIYIIYVWCCLKKVTFFKENCEKWQFNVASFYVQGNLGLEIRNWDHLWTRFNAMNAMTISKKLTNEPPLENIFFEVSQFVSICVNL